MIISLFPVVVTKISASGNTSSTVFTLYPAIQACNAHIGSTSDMITLAFSLLIASDEPLPTSPYPQIIAVFPEIKTSIALFIPSGNECLQPYTLSNLLFVTESLTLIAWNKSLFSFSI